MRWLMESLAKQNQNRLNLAADTHQNNPLLSKFFVSSAEDYDELESDSLDLC